IRQRFLRGMITHDLVQRGLDFDLAYSIAQSIRSALAGREEVTTEEIRNLIREQLTERLGTEVPPHLTAPLRPSPELHVLRHGQRLPFSRGLLARSLLAAGLELDRAHQLVTELVDELRSDGIEELPSDDLIRRVSGLLDRREGSQAARSYRLLRRIHRLPRPLVIYVGGASGTGKSTLSLELAPLLRIYRISATDTIRQVMRMMFSPQVMPALHVSSFEVSSAGGLQPVDDHGITVVEAEAHESPLPVFEEQARRVVVGVRAVVERAIAENMNVLVEGVHLCPPLVPFADLEGAVYQIPLVLGTLDDESHRARFLSRARLGGRRAERYLENFAAIRETQDFILQQAETHDVPMLDTSYGDPPVARTVRLITGLLQRKLPQLDDGDWEVPRPPTPTLMLIIDGLADRPIRALGGRTPLQAAEIPTLHRLAREGSCGLADTVAPGVVPDTSQGCLALFGQSPLALKRGPVEALGAEAPLSAGDVALRGNLATLDESGNVIDRRAGRIREQADKLAAAIDRLELPGVDSEEFEVRVRAGTEHRLAVVLRGDGLSSAIEGSDPGEGAVPGPPQVPRPLDPTDEAAAHTAQLLALWEQEAGKVLEAHSVNRRRKRKGLPVANAVLTRGAGRIHRLIPLQEAGMPLDVICIAGDRTVLGLARWLGADTFFQKGMTANLDTDLGLKFQAAEKALRRSDLVVVHVKGADIAAHDRRPDLKVAFLERCDKRLAKLLEKHEGPLRVVVAADHATLAESGQHAADPLPVLIWGEGIEADSVERFDETAAAAGSLRRFPLQMLLSRLYDLR
ncbi:MAG: hypothetical protein R3325_10885, partial [Thermoanaerobaculia bacterium]|nr:hypothetical protein [Thermoanaerobaculia bacterium]